MDATKNYLHPKMLPLRNQTDRIVNICLMTSTAGLHFTDIYTIYIISHSQFPICLYNVYFGNYSSFVKDDITYRALPDLDDIVSHPMPTRMMRSVTPPPIFTSGAHNGGKTYF